MNRKFENPATLANEQPQYLALIEIEHEPQLYSPSDFPVWLAVFAGLMMLTPIAVLVRQIAKRK